MYVKILGPSSLQVTQIKKFSSSANNDIRCCSKDFDMKIHTKYRKWQHKYIMHLTIHPWVHSEVNNISYKPAATGPRCRTGYPVECVGK